MLKLTRSALALGKRKFKIQVGKARQVCRSVGDSGGFVLVGPYFLASTPRPSRTAGIQERLSQGYLGNRRIRALDTLRDPCRSAQTGSPVQLGSAFSLDQSQGVGRSFDCQIRQSNVGVRHQRNSNDFAQIDRTRFRLVRPSASTSGQQEQTSRNPNHV